MSAHRGPEHVDRARGFAGMHPLPADGFSPLLCGAYSLCPRRHKRCRRALQRNGHKVRAGRKLVSELDKAGFSIGEIAIGLNTSQWFVRHMLNSRAL